MSVLISVCIPAYNNGTFIGETLDAVFAQTYVNFELIVVDDCSTDNTWDLLKSYADPRLKIYRNEKNLGMHGNWSKVLSMANGDYIKLLCGDDLIDPNCLELQVKALEAPENKDVAMVVCKRKIITASGGSSFGSFYKLSPGKYSGKKAMRYCATFGTNLIGEPMSVLFRAGIFKQQHIALGSNNYLIDLDLYSKLLKYGSLLVQPELLAAFRIYATSMSGTLGWKHARYFRDFIHEERFKTDFGFGWRHRSIGTLITYGITLARNVIFKISR